MQRAWYEIGDFDDEEFETLCNFYDRAEAAGYEYEDVEEYEEVEAFEFGFT